jgi:hypothetical protein
MESKIKLLDQMRLVLRLKHMSIRTEEAYVLWVRRFILFHHKRHPKAPPQRHGSARDTSLSGTPGRA